MEPEKNRKLSIHRFIETAANGGDLLSGFFSQKRALEGIKGHQKVQKDRGENYQKEIPLKKVFSREDFSLTLEGRVDGAILEKSRWVLEEIKTLEGSFPENWENAALLHRAQILCYGAMWDYEGDSLDLELCYVHLHTGEQKRFRKSFTREYLEKYLQDCLDRYFRDQKDYHLHIGERDRSSESLDFPFGDFRPGQRAFSVEVYRAVKDREILFCQAPTGVGKTMAALFPAIKAWGENLHQKILYLTAKTSGRASVQSAMKILEKKGLFARTVILTAKEKICQSPESPRCHGQDCPFARSYYDKLEQVREEFLGKQVWGREDFETLAHQYSICPFELSLEWGLKADVLVGDFNHLFDPIVSLKRYFQQGESVTLLLDEAHNLPDRSRNLYTAELEKTEILKIRRDVRDQDPALGKALSALNKTFLQSKKEHIGVEKKLLEQIPPSLIKNIKRILQEGDRFLRKEGQFGDFSGFYFQCRFFLQIAEIMGKGHRIVLSMGNKRVSLKLLCLDASTYIVDSLKKCSSSIFFSATLEPLSYFKESLLGETGCRDYRIASPFPRENCRVLIRRDIGTRYKEREESLSRLLSAIGSLRESYPGHQMAFFPSYKYMEQAAEYWQKQFPGEGIVLQSRGMTEEEKQVLLNRLDDQEPQLIFAVLGGVFSEGIDLQGDRLIALSIVSVGLPSISFEGDLLKRFYDEKGGKGFLYASSYPGWNRILQASGRLIRSEKDRGIILLLGRRFCEPFYRSLRPGHWSNLKELSSDKELIKEINSFKGGR